VKKGDFVMNRQQRRKMERQAKKDNKVFKNTLTNPKQRTENEPLIRSTWNEAAIYTNHEWAVRLERIKEVKGIGPKMLGRIFEALEEPLTVSERQKARSQYEVGEAYAKRD
jgi:hypothetical protein